ncbi:hypothetical protein [Polycladidibacter hongkongensis]|uniref:hypothetical protein n=1 Tax=Polycladidibacter hongkongensis TaxID=1647556 RepID=UPI000A5D196A|nr:hypothetical protein [Pseudovibrio hongkongensis]
MSDPILVLLGLKIMYLIGGVLWRAGAGDRASACQPFQCHRRNCGGGAGGGLSHPCGRAGARALAGPCRCRRGGGTGFMLGMYARAQSDGLIKLSRRWCDDPRLPK